MTHGHRAASAGKPSNRAVARDKPTRYIIKYQCCNRVIRNFERYTPYAGVADMSVYFKHAVFDLDPNPIAGGNEPIQLAKENPILPTAKLSGRGIYGNVSFTLPSSLNLDCFPR